MSWMKYDKYTIKITIYELSLAIRDIIINVENSVYNLKRFIIEWI